MDGGDGLRSAGSSGLILLSIYVSDTYPGRRKGGREGREGRRDEGVGGFINHLEKRSCTF
jgi:hypothetical protein